MCIFVLIGIVGIQWISMRVLLKNLREAQKEVASWKLAAEHWEKQANGW